MEPNATWSSYTAGPRNVNGWSCMGGRALP